MRVRRAHHDLVSDPPGHPNAEFILIGALMMPCRARLLPVAISARTTWHGTYGVARRGKLLIATAPRASRHNCPTKRLPPNILQRLIAWSGPIPDHLLQPRDHSSESVVVYLVRAVRGGVIVRVTKRRGIRDHECRYPDLLK
jgi:hypothetical protein